MRHHRTLPASFPHSPLHAHVKKAGTSAHHSARQPRLTAHLSPTCRVMECHNTVQTHMKLCSLEN